MLAAWSALKKFAPRAISFFHSEVKCNRQSISLHVAVICTFHFLFDVFQCAEKPVDQIIYLADILERCDFQAFWNRILGMPELSLQIVGFADSIRKFVCHVVGITFQTVEKALLSELLGGVDSKFKVC